MCWQLHLALMDDMPPQPMETGKAYIWSVLDKDEEPWLLEPHNDDGRVLNKLQYRQDGNYLIGLRAI